MDERQARQLGKRLRRLRLGKGLTQLQLASPKYTHAFVSTIEAGRRAPSNAAIQHFAAKLGVHPDELRTGRPASLLPELEVALQEARTKISAGRSEEARPAIASVLATARRFALPAIEAKAHEHMALIHERERKLDSAIESYEMAERLLDDEPLHARADATAGKARCFHLKGEKTHAIYLLETLLYRLEQEGLPDPDALIRLYTSLAITYVEAGFLRQAADAGDAALELEQRVSDPTRLGAMHNMVARVLLEQGQTSRAEDSLKQAAHFYRLAELELELGRAHLARGIFLSRTGKSKAAKAELSTALETFEATQSPIDEARAANELARVEREGGRERQAVELAQQALKLLEEGDLGELARAKRELGLAMGTRERPAATEYLREAIDLFVQAEERVEAAITHGQLGDLLSGQSQREGCRTYRDGISLLETQFEKSG